MKHILQLLALMVILTSADLFGKTLIFPPAALGDLVKLGPARIEARWKPRSIPDGYFPTVEGYYVIYNHDKLSLFFGPVDTEREAVKIQSELEEIRKYLISQSPSLSSSTVGRINIDFGGETPTGQTGANDIPPEGLKPVRILSGNSTLELGKENKVQNSTTGSSTDGPLSSDYGLGASTEGADDNPQDLQEGGAGTGGGNGSNETSDDGESEALDESNAAPGSGILNVLSQGSSAPGNELGDLAGTPVPQKQNTGTDPGSPIAQGSAPEGGELEGDPNAPGQSEQPPNSETGEAAGATDPKTGELEGTESLSKTQPSVSGAAQESLDSPGTREASDSDQQPGSLNSTPGSGEPGEDGQEAGPESNSGATGSESEDPSAQPPPTPPEGLEIPVSPPGLPQAQPGSPESQPPTGTNASEQNLDQPEGELTNNGEPGASAPEAAAEELNAVNEASQGDPALQQESTETAQSDSTSAEPTTEDSAEATSSTGEESPTQQTQEKTSKEPVDEAIDASEQIMEELVADDTPEVEESSEETLNSPPPSSASLELRENEGVPVSEAATIHINHLLKRKLGAALPVPDSQGSK
ncbi:MAG: hypothetical protein O7C75_01910 [Verrucomicrobia bacterium]|nr:hypothetical protein [Verrucomicrobiota bacterium]